ncbi:prepilin-type N-terminal cleavage/methylation domain-containing protein [Oricola sp.]|uniref:PulJ/GspJ family protein n=1 Tax=Oricola sp. TaxID=1979950 RepID=UPI0025ED7B0F|nr:prepilin-type N-terminal cleavage/methylation domain-containing protein [Oricola sp.]MCI5075349.1 prepilin-type N-terminal cleavage/methylation domain-containing protein [Oricola sp.]
MPGPADSKTPPVRMNGHAAKETNPESGFTLIEMLVALSLVAIISLMAAGFLGQLRLWNGRFASEVPRQELAATARYLENAIAGALMLPIDLADNDERLYFVGTPDSLTFVSHSRVGLAEAALRTVHVGIADVDGGHDLVQILRPRRFHAASITESDKIVILPKIHGIGFEYLERAPDGASRWTTDWSASRRLPLAVRFHLTATRNGDMVSVSGATRLTLASAANMP